MDDFITKAMQLADAYAEAKHISFMSNSDQHDEDEMATRSALLAHLEGGRDFPIRMERVKGSSIEEMRKNLSRELYSAGDCIVCWVNEGDFAMRGFAAVFDAARASDALKGE